MQIRVEMVLKNKTKTNKHGNKHMANKHFLYCIKNVHTAMYFILQNATLTVATSGRAVLLT